MKKIILSIVLALIIVIAGGGLWMNYRANIEAKTRLNTFLYEYQLDEHIVYADSSYNLLTKELTLTNVDVYDFLPTINDINVNRLSRTLADQRQQDNPWALFFSESSEQAQDTIHIEYVKLQFSDDQLSKISLHHIDAPIEFYLESSDLGLLFTQLGYGQPKVDIMLQASCESPQQDCQFGLELGVEDMASLSTQLILSYLDLAKLSPQALETVKFHEVSLRYQDDGLYQRLGTLYQYAHTVNPNQEPESLKSFLQKQLEELSASLDDANIIPKQQLDEMKKQQLHFIEHGKGLTYTVKAARPVNVSAMIGNTKEVLSKFNYQLRSD